MYFHGDKKSKASRLQDICWDQLGVAYYPELNPTEAIAVVRWRI